MVATHVGTEDLAARRLQPALAGRGRGLILVVEDNRLHQRLIARLLHKAGYHTRIAENGGEALALLSRGAVDLVLMDGYMGPMDGVATARRIRGNPEWDGLPLIAVTADADAVHRQRYLDAGMDDYVSKPFKDCELVGKVAAWLSRARRSRARAA